jgi:hypothetical protein
MSWLLLSPLALLAVAVLLIPGAALGYALGLRGTAVLLPAAALSMSLISLLAIGYAAIGVPWSLGSFTLGAAAVVAAAFGVRALVSRRWGWFTLRLAKLNLRSLGAGLAIWAALTGYTMIRLFRDPTAFIQSYDNVFHLNVVQYILDTGKASTFTIGSLTSGGQPSTYPAAWHGYASLLLGTARAVDPGIPIGSAVNAATIAVVVFAWALGCLVLVQVLAGGSLGVSVLTAATLGTLYVFPWAFLPEGGLYPNLLGNSLLPGAFTLVYLISARLGERALAARPTPGIEPARLDGNRPLVPAFLVLALMLPGITLAHPNSTFTLLVLALAVTWGLWFSWSFGTEQRGRRQRWIALAALIAATVGFALAWVLLAPPRPTPGRAPTNLADAFWYLFQGAVSTASLPAPALTALVLIGLVGAVRHRWIAAAAAAGFASVVFVMALGGPTGKASIMAGAVFYNDTKRIAAFALICALPLVIGALGMIDRGLRALLSRSRVRAGAANAWQGVAVIVLAAVIAVPLQLWSLSPEINYNSKRLVVLSATTRRMSLNEYQLISAMRKLVPAGEKVIANPGGGGGFIYAVSGVPLVFPHSFVADTPAMHQLRESMFDPAQLPQTCAAMAELNAHFYYHTNRKVTVPTHGTDYFPALDKPELSMLTLVASNGPAGLYRFSACDQ